MSSARRSYLEALADAIEDEIVVSCLGDSSRQWENLKPKPSNIYLRGAMSLAIPVGVGVAVSMPDHRVVILEGDGSLLMNLGTLATVGELNLPNLTILLFNNEIYESSGAQPLPARHIDYAALARAAGIRDCATFETADGFGTAVGEHIRRKDSSFLCLKLAHSDDWRPAPLYLTPIEIKGVFLEWVRSLPRDRSTE